MTSLVSQQPDFICSDLLGRDQGSPNHPEDGGDGIEQDRNINILGVVKKVLNGPLDCNFALIAWDSASTDTEE